MHRFFCHTPTQAIKLAAKYERMGYLVDMGTDGDVLVVTVYTVHAVPHALAN